MSHYSNLPFRAWEQRKLNDIVKLENGYAFKSTYFSDVPSKTIVLTPGNVRIGGGFKNGKGRYYNEISEFPHKFIFQPEDIFVPLTDLTPSAQMLGYPAVVPNDGIKYLHNQRLGKLTDFKGDKFFLFQLLSTNKYHKYIAATAIGTTVKHSSIQKILQYDTSFPSFEEQKNIGIFFKQLDHTIALHQRKLDALKLMKKAFLQQMFPNSEEKVPRLRFVNFDEEWEQRMLNEIANRYDNLRVPITASARISGTTPYYGANGIQDYVEGFTHDGEFILVAEDGANDVKNYPVQYVNGKIWVNNHAHVLQAKENKHDNKFLMNAIKMLKIEPFLVGGGRAKLNSDVMMTLIVKLPCYEEQKKIGTFLQRLDNAITLHKNKINKLSSLKKTYLQNMFI
ncbi:restriction endonuclease subunit S [Listeria monocytogenes]|nr:restriction endonuclease subunit S [Listeria monocytogenes serotype 1/2a]EAW7252326.1 restriction endonuclease subunit S [Listeria monocytogenes]EHC6209761.1 restriction endonuclease subunit S [Listeria monocytogenes serotype 1/2b]EAF4566825.1 restriction endonuclease subunit S [Listeria monocytogenes serotype 1/2a]ECC0303652.1 restriction endonuclease subunit S [Listeria monocytogenes]